MSSTVANTGVDNQTWGGGNAPLKASYGKMMMWFFIVSDALTFSGFLAAYGFSRHPLRGNDTYLFIILTTRMLPPIIVIVPIFLIFRVTGLAGTYTGIILIYID